MKLTCATKISLFSIVNSAKHIATKLQFKVIVASALLIGVTGSIAIDSIVLTAPSDA
jgi:internalin A